MPLNVIIVGGGIAGCAAGIGLCRHGHRVRIYERRATSDQEESGAGIQLQPNMIKIIDAWGMRSELERIAHENTLADMRNPDGSRIAVVDRGRRAIEAGCEVFEGVRISNVDVKAEKPSITLENGTNIKGDILLGADGAFSKVRQALFQDSRAKATDNTSWQIQLDYDFVRNDPVLRELVDPEVQANTMRCGPGINTLAFPIPKQGQYEVEPIDHQYSLEQDPRPDLFNERVYDLGHLKERFKDFDKPTRKAIDCAESAYKWRFTEVCGLKSWSNKNGRVILLGDACHAMLPYSGQGSAVGVEDAVTLAELLADVDSEDDIRPLIDIYEKLRMPRCQKIQTYARFQERRWSTDDPKEIAERDALWKTLDVQNGEFAQDMIEQAYAKVAPDEDAPFGTPGFMLWLDHYDAFKAVQEAKTDGDTSLGKL